MAEGVTGTAELEAVARRLKSAGRGDLRKELLVGIRVGIRPVIPEIRANARTTLPNSGGLADLVSRSSIGVRTRLGRNVSVAVRGTGRVNLARLNAGILRHPVFGNRQVWVSQRVREGWFTNPLERNESRLRRNVDDAVRDVARKVEHGGIS